MKKIKILFILMIIFSACSSIRQVQKSEEPAVQVEVNVQYITLEGAISEPKAEISGLAWYNDYLILLPQYPHLFPSEYDGTFFAIPKGKIAENLNEIPNTPISPIPINVKAPNLMNIIEGYEGFESIAFYENTVFFTVESEPDAMMGYLMKGTISDDMKTITVDVDERVELPPRAPIENATDETIIVTPDRVITIYEWNSMLLENQPYAYMFDHSLNLIDSLSMPYVEYRITDATQIDENDNFWVINYMWSGDYSKNYDPSDPIAEKYGKGSTHKNYKTVERLLEFHFSPRGISLVNTHPIQLKLTDDENSRNWEGIVRYDDKGFLIVTDKFPRTLLGYVKYPE
ncbi:MAG TPA: hypothetical protein ENG70_03970 [Candidatus Cloacimonetes bacterium]|nr:hypothetical protein [Candidatus Cloacimonadota bacterium]HEX37999.1 hypothetical protein [Candidatus Cloacimonadota bacterium]